MVRWLLAIAVVLLAAFLGYQWLTFPNVSDLASNSPKTTSFMERRKRELRRAGKNDQIFYRWMPYSRISPYLRRAVLVSEDSSFYQHEGIDVEGLKEALRRDWESKRFTHGGSTITQQLAKNLYLSPTRSPVRKLKEFLIARVMERQLSKKRILELYLNVVEMGERVYGAEAASRYHFDKSAAALTPAEAALLAGSLPNPRVMVPSRPNRRLRSRQRIILSRMRRWGHLAEQQVLTAKAPPPPTPEPAPVEEPPVIDTSVPDVTTTDTTATEPVLPPPTDTTTAPPPPEPSTTTSTSP